VTTRVLPPAEWNRLAETELGPALPHLDPASATVFVVEDVDGAIVGCWSLITVAHVEGLWIAPAHRRRGRVLVKLWALLCELTGARSLSSVLTAAVSPEVTRLIESRGGVALPPAYALPVQPLRS
jgi:hypothetical protein